MPPREHPVASDRAPLLERRAMVLRIETVADGEMTGRPGGGLFPRNLRSKRNHAQPMSALYSGMD
jgi:hypothetical protein